MHTDAALRGMFGKAAPAATDLQHAITGTQAELIDDALIFVCLRPSQALREITSEDCTRIGPAGIEPALVEGIANVVMGMDILAAALTGIGAQPMAQAIPEFGQFAAEHHALH